MHQPIIDPTNREEQLYYSTINNEINLENSSFQEDKYFIDQTISNNQDEDTKSKLLKIGKIIRTDLNSFILRELFFIKWTIIIYFILGIIIALGILYYIEFSLNAVIASSVTVIIYYIYGICLGFKLYYNEYLVLESNSIVITKKSLFGKKDIVYNFGELEKAEIYYKYINSEDGYDHRFTIYLIKSSGEKEEIRRFDEKNIEVDLKGVKYFVDLLNEHIRTHMK